MKLEDLERIGRSQPKGKRRFYSRATSNDVLIGAYAGSTTKNGTERFKVKLSVLNEPGCCHFGRIDYWKPIFVKEEQKLYLIYAKKADGYRKQTLKHGIGFIEFYNGDLIGLLELKEYTKKKPLAIDWKMDKECGRPYIVII